MLSRFQKYLPHIKPSWNLAYPVMLSQLGHVLMGVTDSIMVGHVGATSLAAASLANVVFNILMLFGIGVSFAITPLVASAEGEHDSKQIGEVLKHGLAICVVNGLILIGVVFLGQNILYHLDQPVDVVDLSIPYLNILMFSLLPVLVFQAFRQFADGLSLTKVAMIIMLSSVVANVFLNYLFIYGHGGFPAMGLVGAGLATLTSRIIMAGAIILYIYYAKRFSSYRGGFAIGNYSSKLFKQLLNIGLPAGLQFIFEVAAFDFSAIMMGWFGTKTLAAHQIAINLATISYMTTSGLAAAATIRVSNQLGRRNIPLVRELAFTLLGMALFAMTIWAILFMAGRNLLPKIYVEDLDVITIAAPLIFVAGLFQLSDGIQVVCTGALRGLHDVKVPSLLIFIAYWIIGLPLGYVLGFKTSVGPPGVWLGLLIGLTLTAAAMFIRFNLLTKKLLVQFNGR